jgi:probable rRNA maturation factor
LAFSFISELPDYKLDNITKVKSWLVKVLSSEKKRLGKVNYIFVSRERILEINRGYLGHDYFTDVISFDKSFLNTINGEIYICIPIVNENSKELSNNITEEILRVIVHGLLHLIGYRDLTAEERKQMTLKENMYLKSV